jgi:23S rRNA (uracil1939-C5)-methyltransferase
MTEKIVIKKLSKKGDGIGFIDNVKVEIPRAIVGDTVVAELYRKRKGIKRGKLIEVLDPSPDRVEPKCKHASFCGGCSLQQMSYAAQLEYKQAFIKNIFLDYADSDSKYKDIAFLPILSMKDPWCYRNKMEFTFSENRAKMRYLGLMMGKKSRFVFNLEECFLASSWFSDTVVRVKNWWDKYPDMSAYNPFCNAGLLKNLTLRESFFTKQKMVILTILNGELSLEEQKSFIDTVKSDDVSIYLRHVTTAKKEPTRYEDIHLFGEKNIEEVLNVNGKKIRFKIGPSSFFQPNTLGAEMVYSAALNMPNAMQELGILQKESAKKRYALICDLYAGAGGLGMLFSSLADKVIGIEENSQAVEDGRVNIALNGIDNVTMYAGDVGKILQSMSIKPDLVILDPPRMGLNLSAIEEVKKLNAKEIIYISCNPLTQYENIKELKGYQLIAMQPIDQFPHTYHVENIVYLKLL